jgi:transposase
MARMVLKLDEASRIELERVVKRGENWRERERAQTLLMLGQGVFAEEVARRLGLNVRTVGTTRGRWLDSGLESLADLPRSGAPRKLRPEDVERLVGWAKAEPLTAPCLLARHEAHGGPHVHLNTLVATLKASGLVWKRTRHSLKKAATRPLSGKQP